MQKKPGCCRGNALDFTDVSGRKTDISLLSFIRPLHGLEEYFRFDPRRLIGGLLSVVRFTDSLDCFLCKADLVIDGNRGCQYYRRPPLLMVAA
jgi:hypothetical protein